MSIRAEFGVGGLGSGFGRDEQKKYRLKSSIDGDDARMELERHSDRFQFSSSGFELSLVHAGSESWLIGGFRIQLGSLRRRS